MDSPTEFVDRRRPAGSKRSSKRDRVVSLFLAQHDHLTADDLAALVSTADRRISRATVYRTLQWMVDAGMAQKVDFGDRRARYERAYRHPRHFHLVCERCQRSVEFISADIEGLINDVCAAHGFLQRQASIHVHGECESCRTGVAHSGTERSVESVCARDALRVAMATEKSGLAFYTRAAGLARDARARRVFEELADEERRHFATLEQRYAALINDDPSLETQPAFLFFRAPADGIFAAGVEELLRVRNDGQALLLGIRCERASHRFFAEYAHRFEESEGRRIFEEFADEEKEHMDRLVEELRALRARRSGHRPAGDGPSR